MMNIWMFITQEVPFYILAAGLLIGVLILAFILWHIFFMVILPSFHLLSRRFRTETYPLKAPALGLTMADGGEKIKKEGVEKHENQ